MQRLHLSQRLQLVAAHGFLLFYTLLAVFPVFIIIVNSFKGRRAIFANPYALPTSETWDLVGYQTLFKNGNYPGYFLNSIIVVGAALILILFLGSMAAFAFSEYKFPGNTLLSLYASLGIMIPIRLGTVSLLRLVVDLNLINTLLALILVYTAQGLPLAIFILTSFMQQVPKDLKDAGRVDGASEYRIFWLILPLVRPALGTVAVFTMIPVWNDLWFPLILAPAEAVKTLTLGSQSFLGQFLMDWNAILAALALSIIPILILYIIFARQLVRGITSGAVK
ncbi:MAG: carbohydrate ABC transporter permease [Anaerolineae bacterium]|nr:carbohydrate ABC transporter permease [Anaerolineae bacterium]